MPYGGSYGVSSGKAVPWSPSLKNGSILVGCERTIGKMCADSGTQVGFVKESSTYLRTGHFVFGYSIGSVTETVLANVLASECFSL